MEVSAYSVADDGHTLDLIISIYTQAIPLVPLDTQAIPPETVTRDQVETGFSRLLGFYDRARGTLAGSLEESTAAFDMGYCS